MSSFILVSVNLCSLSLLMRASFSLEPVVAFFSLPVYWYRRFVAMSSSFTP